MCGIIGFSGEKNAANVLLAGLQALSYRGYDSAGIALSGEEIYTVKTKGRISELSEKVSACALPEINCGIGHTRWATHGAPSEVNAHPHSTELVSLVHNGIIENYNELALFLKTHGYTLHSETDSETAVCLIDWYYKKSGSPSEAIYSAVKDIRGSFAFAVLFKNIPGTIYAIRRDSPLIAAKTENGVYIASDITALVDKVDKYYRPDDNILMVLKSDGLLFFDDSGSSVDVSPKTVNWTPEQAQRGGYKHFMLKEMHEEPFVLSQTVSSCLKDGLPHFEDEGFCDEFLKTIKRIHIVACGSAMHAGLIGKEIIERLSKVPVDVSIASEFRYSNPLVFENELVLLISQSGETADTLAALRHAKKLGAKVFSIINVVGSAIAAESDSVIYTAAGPEIAVASTKAYMVQCAVLYLFAVRLALVHKQINDDYAKHFCQTLQNEVSKAVESVIEMDEEIASCAESICEAENLFYIGRCTDAAICTEGSLKLKEISYIHSEAFAAGEMKHGTISLITNETPVIALLTVFDIAEKTISGIREVAARDASVLAICSAKISKNFAIPCRRKFVLPDIDDLFAIFPAVTAMQLLAYHVSVLRGNDVDKPRHLAKAVTVE